MKKILGCVRKAVEEYDMIHEGDTVCVGLSGGKDSIVLLYALKLYQNFSSVQYNLEAVTISNGFTDMDFTPMIDFCKYHEIPYTIKETEIGKIVFEDRKESNPCSLCAKMRRGALSDVLNERGSKVLALGHHGDDAIETLFLSLLYSGKMQTFAPTSHLSRKDIWVIRPLIYASEAEVIGAFNKSQLPIVKSTCPVDKKTKREEMKSFTKNIYRTIPNAKQNIISAMKNQDQFGLWFKDSLEKR